ncbi:MAG: hypothetical protein WA207_13180, partial [Candidatus Acidiferrum sp.]
YEGRSRFFRCHIRADERFSGGLQMKRNSVTVLLPFLAYFGAIGDESGGECTKVSVAQVEGKTRTSSVLLAF